MQAMFSLRNLRYFSILVIYLFSVKAVYKDSIPNPFPTPLYPNGPDDPPTPIRTHLEHFIQIFAKYGGVDVFMYIPCERSEKPVNTTEYEPYDGDTAACQLYNQSPIFARHTGNRVFCLIELERTLSDQFISNYQLWRSYAFGPASREVFLQQQYGMYRANLASKEYALSVGFEYKYKVRLRPDVAFVKRVPSPEKFIFENVDPYCKGKTVYYPYEPIFGVSAEDSFNIGEAKEMNYVLDRYMEIVSEPFQFYQNIRSQSRQWNSEFHLKGMLNAKYNVCLSPHGDIWMLKIRRSDHQKPWDHRLRTDRDWAVLDPPYD